MKVESNIIITEKELREFGISIDDVKNDLTLKNPEYTNIVRFGKKRFYRSVPEYLCYLTTGKKGEFLIPRYYSDKLPSNSHKKGRELHSHDNICLRDYQDKFFSDNLSLIKNNTGIIIESPCGHGKTIMALRLSYIRNVQTMIIVPTYYLANQWKESIEKFTTGTCFILNNSTKDIPIDVDFTIVVTDLFNCRILPKELVSNIGHVILDEAHRMGAETYLPILDEIPAMFRTALTATFRRTDGVHRILKYHFGELLKMTNQFPKPLVYGFETGCEVQGIISKNKPHDNFRSFLIQNDIPFKEDKSTIVYDSNKNEMLRSMADDLLGRKKLTKKAYTEIRGCLNRCEKMSYTLVETFLNNSSNRRKQVISLVKRCLESKRNILFLSKRKDILITLHKIFKDYQPSLVISETNKRSKEEQDYIQNKCPLILGVNQLAKEGLDVARLDTLIIYLPMADTEQAIGRIARLFKGKKQPIAFYIVDKCPLTYATFNKAKKMFHVNGDYKGNIKLNQLKNVL